MRLLQRFFRGLRRGLLLRRVEEDGGTVLRAPVRSLAVELRGVVVLPEDFQQVCVAHLRRIVLDLNRFGVAGAIGTNFFVGGIVGVSAGIAHAGGYYAGHLAEGGFDSPETSRCECGFFHLKIAPW